MEKAGKEGTCQKDRQQGRQEYNRTSTQPREERERELFVRDGGKTEAWQAGRHSTSSSADGSKGRWSVGGDGKGDKDRA